MKDVIDDHKSNFELLILNDIPTLLIKNSEKSIKINLTEEIMNRLLHLLTVASIEYGDKNAKA